MMNIYAEIYITTNRDNDLRTWAHSVYKLRHIYNEYYWCPVFFGDNKKVISFSLRRCYNEQLKVKHTKIDCMMTVFKFKSEDLVLET